MDYSFDNCVSGVMETALKVDIDENFLRKIRAFVEALIQRKKGEAHHKIDNQKEIKRFSTGYLGEAALEKVFNIPIIDWSIGDSSKYHVPDIPGYAVGIKTVEYGKFPVIFKRNTYPQIICISDPATFGVVYICGLASPDVLNKYQSDDLILDSKLRARGTKTGFYGFHYLEHISGLSDIEKYRKEQIQKISTYANKIYVEQTANNVNTDRICPQCGSPLILRNGKFGEFFGCSNYPSCKHTENI